MGRAGAALWARADLRGRWKSLVALGLLVGLTAGFAIAAFAGARRTDASFERLRDGTNGADAIVFATQTQNFIIDIALWDALEAQPEVENVAPWVLAIGTVSPGDGDGQGVMMGPLDDRWLQVVDEPVVVEGRMWDPEAADEIVIDEYSADSENVGVGDTVTFHAYEIEQLEQGDSGPPTGPEIELEVVGIVRTIQPFVFAPLPMMSPGVIAKYGRPDDPNRIVFGTNAMVQLRNDTRDIPGLQRDVNSIIEEGTPLLDLHAVQRRVDTTLDVESAALRLLALAIAVAGGLLVGQALSRSAATIQSDASTLRAVGLRRREMTGAAIRAHGIVAIVAVVFACVVALVASRWFPVGLAADIDPDRGFHADWTVLAVGVVLTMLFVTVVVAWSAHRAVRTRKARRSRRATSFVDGVQRRTPVSVGVGTALVMERGRARVNVPVRQAIAGAVIGVVGVVATLTINANLREAIDHPERAGVAFDIQAQTSSEAPPDATYESLLAVARANPDVDAISSMHRELLKVDDIGIPTFTIDAMPEPAGEPITFTMIDGRAPDDGEAVIGPKSARDLDVGIGDTVTIGAEQRVVRIVGHGLFPQDVHSEFDEGLWITRAELEQAEPEETLALPRTGGIAIRVKPDADADEVAAAIGDAAGDNYLVLRSEVPQELENLRYVRTLPIALAVFLGLLALAALLHVLMTVARTRRSDFAVLRALGMTRRSTRAVVNVQGTTVAVIGLVVGIPLGVLLGREVWHLISESVPLEQVAVYQWLALGVVVVVGLVVANVLALWPGRRAARLQPAEVLRRE